MEQINQPNYRSRSICPRIENIKNYYAPMPGLYTSKSNYIKPIFLQEKEKGDYFFRNTKVGSCRKILVKNGSSLALTFKIRNLRGEPLANYKHTLKQLPKLTTSYFLDFCTPKTENHIGMKKKPLVPYNPDHTRNKLMDDFGFRMRRNFSSFNIGKEDLINRKQWISTYKDSFKKMVITRISNPGILSDMAKRTRYKFNNIEYA